MARRPPSSPRPGGPRWETPDPPGVAGTYGGLVISWAQRKLGITIDRWQARTLRRALRYDRNGDLIHRTALWSTGRQNGKSVAVRVFYGWLLDEGHALPAFAGWTEIIAAAHDAKQARLLYSGVARDLLAIPEIAKLNRPGSLGARDVRITDQLGIEIRGLRLDTVTGQPGSARGHAAGAVAWDEVLTQDDWEGYAALGPTQIAQRSPILLMTSTAGFDSSVVLRAFYDRLVRIASGDEKPDPTFYGAWWQSEDPDAGLDWRQVKQANPALGDRLPKRAVAAEYAILPPDNWRRERLNHWVRAKLPGAFNPGVWAALRTPDALAGVEPPYTIAVDVQPGWERATIAVAAVRPDGRIGVELHRDLRAEPGRPITSQRIIDELTAFRPARAAVVYDAASGAAPELNRFAPNDWGCEWIALKPSEIVASCMDFTEMVLSGRLAADDVLLDEQIANVARRDVGQDGAFRFSRAQSAGPIDAIVAAALAAHAAASAAPPPSIT